MNEIIQFFNSNDGFSMIVLTAGLVCITWYYANLTKKLSDNSSKSIDQMDEIRSEENKKYLNTKYNYSALLNTEIPMNIELYLMGLFYLENAKDVAIVDKIKSVTKNNMAISKLMKANMREHAKSRYWDSIYNECSKYFSFELMHELVIYYTGVHKSKMFSIDGMSNENFIEFAKKQLISSHKCFELMSKEGVDFKVK